MRSPSEPETKCDAVRPGASNAGTPALSPAEIASIVDVLAAQKGVLRCTQRSATRAAVLCSVLVWRIAAEGISEPIHAQLVNLSSGGVGLLCGTPLPAFEQILLEMILAGLGQLQWKCSVRWCEPTTDGICRIGAELVDTTPMNCEPISP